MAKNFAHRKPTETVDSTTPATDTVPRPTRGQGKRLNFVERYNLLELHRAHPEWSYPQLAAAAGVHPETARLTCIAAGRSAADLMAAYAAPMLRRWMTASKVAASRGDHRPTREWLLHAGVLDPLPDGRSAGSTSIVIVNSPLPGMPEHTVTVLPSVTPTNELTRVEQKVLATSPTNPTLPAAVQVLEPQD